VRTNLRYLPPSGHDHTISVTGPPVRVLFDPSARDALQQFIARGLRALLDGGDHLLFLVCLLLPVRRARSAAALFVAAALGQTIAIALSVLQPAMTVESLTALAMIAASAVVVAALQNVVRARLRWVGLLALAFGALNGFAFGHALAVSEQFAGSHGWMAVAAFVIVVLLGELWLGALAWATRTWLDERAMPERVVTVVASAIVAHSALHRVIDRGQIIAQTGSFGAERALVWLTLGWACVMMLVALANAISGRTLDSDDAAGVESVQPS
jgi:HupE / UreJ protein